VISVNSLAFKRFLDIARLLKIAVSVITDNDGKTEAKRANYAEYASERYINIFIGEDDCYPTLEPQLLKANGLDKLNAILGSDFKDDQSLLAHMKDNKADTALKIFDSTIDFDVPTYIKNAVQ
jgi:putative ATP-dependent endonuclease of the OLD family